VRLDQMRDRYPNAARLIRLLADQRRIDTRAGETLTEAALARIEAGTTPRRDAIALLIARDAMMRRTS
jgi:hypothetical protein